MRTMAAEKEYGIKVKQYRNGIQNLIDNDFFGGYW